MSTRFYAGQADYIAQLNLMDDAVTGAITAAGIAYVPTGSISAINVQDALTELDTEKQPIDATLTAMAGVITSADKLIYFDGVDTATSATITAAGRALLDDADAAAQRTTLGLGTASTLVYDTDVTLAANSDSVIATQRAVRAFAEALVVGLWDDRGNYDASVNTFPASGGSGTAGAILKGDIWNITVAGTLGGVPVVARQTVRAMFDTPAQTASNWAIGLANADIEDSISDGVTGRAPSQNAVFDALATKALLAGSISQAFSTALLSSSGNHIIAPTDGTSAAYTTLQNTGGNYYVGSAGSSTVAFGSTAYALIRVAPTGRVIQDIINNVPINTISSTGLLINGVVSSNSTIDATRFISTIVTGTAPFTVTSTTNVPNLNASSLNGATFAAPGAIGSGTPGSVVATTIATKGTAGSNTIGLGPYYALGITGGADGGAWQLPSGNLGMDGWVYNGVSWTNVMQVRATGLTATGVLNLPTVSAMHTIAGHNFAQGDAANTYFFPGTTGIQLRNSTNSAAVLTTLDGGAAITGTFSVSGNTTLGDTDADTLTIGGLIGIATAPEAAVRQLIRGLGATSSTRALAVLNGGGADIANFYDDKSVALYGTLSATGDLTLSGTDGKIIGGTAAGRQITGNSNTSTYTVHYGPSHATQANKILVVADSSAVGLWSSTGLAITGGLSATATGTYNAITVGNGTDNSFFAHAHAAGNYANLAQAGDAVFRGTNGVVVSGINGGAGMRLDASSNLFIAGDTVGIATAKTPASASATGTTGMVCWDANYMYVCVATNTWKRSAISSW